MPLNIDKDWRFARESVPQKTINVFDGVFEQIANAASDAWDVYETVKSHYGTHARSSSVSWAQSDMGLAMQNAKNTALFLESAWNAIEALKKDTHEVPSERQLNEMLALAESTYRFAGQKLVRVSIAKGASAEAAAAATYTIGAEIGSGGNGNVFRATRTSSDGIAFDWAIKRHRPSATFNAARSRERFIREVEALKKLQHRGIVQYVDAGFAEDEGPFLVMQLIDGNDLRTATNGSDVGETLSIFGQVCDATHYLHTAGVFHRDLKPTNILVRNSDRQPVIVDFGLAFVIDDVAKETITNGSIGSAGYMPPEVSTNPKDSRSPKHDIFSLGIILYELFAGRRPSDLRSFQALAAINPKLAPLDIIVHRAISTADSRYATVQQLMDDLKQASQAITSGGLTTPQGSQLSPQEVAVIRVMYELPQVAFSLSELCGENGLPRAKAKLGSEALQRRGFVTTYRDDEGNLLSELNEEAKVWAAANANILWPD